MSSYSRDEIIFARVRSLMEAGYSQDEAIQMVAESIRAALAGKAA